MRFKKFVKLTGHTHMSATVRQILDMKQRQSPETEMI